MSKEILSIAPSSPRMDADGLLVLPESQFLAFPLDTDSRNIEVKGIETTPDGLLLTIVAHNLQQVVGARGRNEKGQFIAGKPVITETSPYNYQVRISTDPVKPSISRIELQTEKYAPEVRDDIQTHDNLSQSEEGSHTIIEPHISSAEVTSINKQPFLKVTFTNQNPVDVWEIGTSFDYLHRGEVSGDKTTYLVRKKLHRGTDSVLIPVYFESWQEGFTANISFTDRHGTTHTSTQMIVEKQQKNERRIQNIIPPIKLDPNQLVELDSLKQQILSTLRAAKIGAGDITGIRSITSSYSLGTAGQSSIAIEELSDVRGRLRAVAPGVTELVARVDQASGESFLAAFTVVVEKSAQPQQVEPTALVTSPEQVAVAN